jgi:hypothetical protein
LQDSINNHQQHRIPLEANDDEEDAEMAQLLDVCLQARTIFDGTLLKQFAECAALIHQHHETLRNARPYQTNAILELQQQAASAAEALASIAQDPTAAAMALVHHRCSTRQDEPQGGGGGSITTVFLPQHQRCRDISVSPQQANPIQWAVEGVPANKIGCTNLHPQPPLDVLRMRLYQKIEFNK